MRPQQRTVPDLRRAQVCSEREARSTMGSTGAAGVGRAVGVGVGCCVGVVPPELRGGLIWQAPAKSSNPQRSARLERGRSRVSLTGVCIAGAAHAVLIVDAGIAGAPVVAEPIHAAEGGELGAVVLNTRASSAGVAFVAVLALAVGVAKRSRGRAQRVGLAWRALARGRAGSIDAQRGRLGAVLVPLAHRR